MDSPHKAWKGGSSPLRWRRGPRGDGLEVGSRSEAPTTDRFRGLRRGSTHGVRWRVHLTDPFTRCDVLLGLPDVHVEAVERDESVIGRTVSPWQWVGVRTSERGAARKRVAQASHANAKPTRLDARNPVPGHAGATQGTSPTDNSPAGPDVRSRRSARRGLPRLAMRPVLARRHSRGRTGLRPQASREGLGPVPHLPIPEVARRGWNQRSRRSTSWHTSPPAERIAAPPRPSAASSSLTAARGLRHREDYRFTDAL